MLGVKLVLSVELIAILVVGAVVIGIETLVGLSVRVDAAVGRASVSATKCDVSNSAKQNGLAV